MNESTQEILMKKLVDNLPMLRARANLSQAKLAEMSGISRQTLVSVENKKRNLSWNVFLAFVLIFQKNPETKQLLKFLDITTDKFNDYLEEVKQDGGNENGL